VVIAYDVCVWQLLMVCVWQLLMVCVCVAIAYGVCVCVAIAYDVCVAIAYDVCVAIAYDVCVAIAYDVCVAIAHKGFASNVTSEKGSIGELIGTENKAYTHIHRYVHTRMHVCTHTCTHTHTHTQTYIQIHNQSTRNKACSLWHHLICLTCMRAFALCASSPLALQLSRCRSYPDKLVGPPCCG